MSNAPAGASAPTRVPSHLVPLLAMLTALVVLTTDVYLPVLPQLGADLGTSDAAAAATLSASLIGMALAQVVIGPLSDATGRRRPLLLGLAAYAVTHLLCAIAPSIAALIVLRVFTGIATAAVMVVARAVVADVYPGREAARAFATLGAVFGIVPVIAPVLGGLLAHVMSWRGMFVVLAVIGLALIPVTARMVPESLPPEKRIAPHLGAVLKDLGEVVTHRRFLAYAVVVAAMGAMLFGYIGASSFVLQDHFGLSPQGYSYVFAINSLGFFAVSWVARSLVGRTGPAPLLLVGQIGTVVAAAVAAAGVATGLLVLVVAGLLLMMCSFGFVMPMATAIGMQEAPGRAGSAAGVLGIAQFAFGAMASPVAGIGGSPWSMVAVIGVSAVMGLVLRLLLLAGTAPEPAPAHEVL